MEQRTVSWSRELVLDDSLATLREVTLKRLAPPVCADGLVAGGPGKTSVTWSGAEVSADTAPAGRDRTNLL